MFINQSLVAIVFKLINFFALIGLGYYVFKKYLKADMLFSIAQKEADHDLLISQQTTLEHRQRDLDLLIKQESAQCQDFRSNIDEWKKAILSEQDNEKQEHEKLLEILKKRHIHIAEKKENQRVQNTIINAVVNDLEKSLSLNFQDPKKGSDYLNSILRFMNERAL